MTDRELLELAAKAAGLKVNERQQAARDALILPATAPLWINEVSTGWNPLIDDGHALRLAVKLKLLVNVTDFFSFATAGDAVLHDEEIHNGDAYAATRRAIVKAAAAMAPEIPLYSQESQP